MSEQQTQIAENSSTLFNSIWGVQPEQGQVQQPAAEAQPQQEGSPNNEPPTSAQPNTEPIVQTPTPDYNSWVKENFGFENVDAAKQEIERLKGIKPQEELSFANDTSKQVFDLLREGKLEDVYKTLDTQNRLNRLTSSPLDNDTATAAEIIKLSMRQRNPELTDADADFMFNKKYAIPAKPMFDENNETQEEYASKLATWENNLQNLNRELIIEAKMAKPELERLKTELKFPEITAPQQSVQTAPSQEELDRVKQIRDSYVATLNEEYSKFDGYNAPFKDEEVEFTVPFTISDEEKTSLKAELENFDSDAFFEERWFTKEGKPNVNQMMSDLYLLKNRDKIFQKIANEAGSQRLLAKTKQLSNVQVNGNGQTTFQPNQKPEQERLLDAIWGNN